MDRFKKVYVGGIKGLDKIKNGSKRGKSQEWLLVSVLSWWVYDWVEDWGVKDCRGNQKFRGVKFEVLAVHPRRNDKHTTGYMKCTKLWRKVQTGDRFWDLC